MQILRSILFLQKKVIKKSMLNTVNLLKKTQLKKVLFRAINLNENLKSAWHYPSAPTQSMSLNLKAS